MEEIDPENELNWQEASVKGRTKKEIYRIILMKGHYYLPPEVQCSSDFIHDIMVGKKRALKMKDVIMIHAPHIHGLRVYQIIEMAKQHCSIDLYLPELKDDKLPNREFVVNVGIVLIIIVQLVNTLIPENLQEMIDRAMARREYQFVKKKNITMKVLPEFQRMSKETKEMSSELQSYHCIIGQNGRFYQLVKNTEVRRENRAKQSMIEEEKKELQNSFEQRLEIVNDLKDRIRQFEEKLKDSDKNTLILSKLFDAGVIDAEGELLQDHFEDEQA